MPTEETGSSSSYKKALLALEYRPDAKAAYDRLSDKPREFRLEFLNLLEEDPKGPVDEYATKIIDKYNSWLNSCPDAKTNLALQQAREISEKAEKTFIEVIDVLGDSIDLEELLEKLKRKYGGPPDDIILSEDPDIILRKLLNKYNSNTVQLMEKLSIRYSEGQYVVEGRTFGSFVEAAVVADKEKTLEEGCVAELLDILSEKEGDSHTQEETNSNSIKEVFKTENKVMPTSEKILLSMIVLIPGALIAAVTGELFGFGKYLVAASAVAATFYIWMK